MRSTGYRKYVLVALTTTRNHRQVSCNALIPQSELASVGVLVDTVRDEVRCGADLGGHARVPGAECLGAGCRVPGCLGAGRKGPKQLIGLTSSIGLKPN